MATVFYSWQSDLPNATNRGFIEEALERAAKAIRRDNSIEVEPVVVRDTSGMAGSPDIASAIFSRIEQAAVFVCDVSIIGVAGERPTPNPNVLVELGFAVRALGPERVLMVMNTAFGSIEDLPFDLKLKRVIPYSLEEGATGKADTRNRLAGVLETRLKEIFKELEVRTGTEVAVQPTATEQLQKAIEEHSSNRALLARRYADGLVKELVSYAPVLPTTSDLDDVFMEAIGKTVPLVSEFSSVSETAVLAGDWEVAKILYQRMTKLADHYEPPPGFSGSFREVEFDYYKFLGHELAVCFATAFVKERSIDALFAILRDPLIIPVEGPVAFNYLSQYLKILAHRKQRLGLNRISVHADTLKQRHEQSPLEDIVPFSRFVETDFLLTVISGILGKGERRQFWRSWSTIFSEERSSSFIREAQSLVLAQRLTAALELKSIDELKSALRLGSEFVHLLWQGSGGLMFGAADGAGIELIGTRS